MLACVLVVGMIFLAPAVTQTALGRTIGKVHTSDVSLDHGTYAMAQGKFESYPPKQISSDDQGHDSKWITVPDKFLGDEKGSVQYSVKDKNGKDIGDVIFKFSNPAKGDNTCDVVTDHPENIKWKCHIGFQSFTAAHFCVWSSTPVKETCDDRS